MAKHYSSLIYVFLFFAILFFLIPIFDNDYNNAINKCLFLTTYGNLEMIRILEM